MPLLTIPGEGAGMQVADSLITAILGYAVVFLGLVLLMLVLSVIGKLFAAKAAKKDDVTVEEAPAPQAPAAPAPTAPGTAGEVKLHNVEPKTAAMLMAIVADKMQKPINELRFISIKEVE